MKPEDAPVEIRWYGSLVCEAPRASIRMTEAYIQVGQEPAPTWPYVLAGALFGWFA